jgi:predicted HTH transcriptional regulator
MVTNDPSALLQRLLREENESPWLEFKVNNNHPEMIGEWVSACANAAILANKDRAFLVFGVENKTKQLVGTSVRLQEMKKGGENFSNWLSRLIEPRLMMEFLDFQYQGKNFSILTIEPTYDRPVRFSGTEYIRIGENVKKLAEFPSHERSLWMVTGRRKFESAIALPHQRPEQVLALLDADAYYELAKEEKPQNEDEILRRFSLLGFISEDMEGGFDITNLGAILFAREIPNFPSIATKSIRVIKYAGTDKRKSEQETEGKKGYAVGFAALLRFIGKVLPSEEKYTGGIRNRVPVYPETAIREVIANALIHQDFTISGAGPVIEIYQDRIEVTNPGDSLIEVDRMIDERQSRNEKLAATMRSLGLCEERGGGIDKALMEIEERSLPAPDFNSSANSMRVVLYGPKPFNELSKSAKMQACFFHCVLRWLKNDYMSNTSLRERFSLDQDEYQAVSAIISESVKRRRIVPADPDQGKRNARYVPYWTRSAGR